MYFFEKNKEFKIMKLLESLQRTSKHSQYSLAGEVGVVPGLVNRYIYEQSEVGHIEVKAINQRVKSYHLNSQGEEHLRFLKIKYYNEIIDMYLELEREVENYLKVVSAPEELVLFGANPIAHIIIGLDLYYVPYLVDNDSRLYQRKWRGRRVFPVEPRYLDGKTIVICSGTYFEEMEEQLENLKTNIPGINFDYIEPFWKSTKI